MTSTLTYVFLILLNLTFAFQIETQAALLCPKVFQSTKSGAEILHEKNSQLHTSKSVERTTAKYKQATGDTLQKPTDKLNAWLDYLTRISTKSESSARTREQVKAVLYNQYVLKQNEVPESHYYLQIQIARERGHGDINLSAEQRKELAETLIIDQKKSLESWVDYLISKDTKMYPMWLKYWMFTGMAKLSKYDTRTGSFGSRDKTTVAPFAELNREALGLVADYVMKSLSKNSLEEINDPELQKLLVGLNFGKIYGHILFKLGVGKEGQFKTNEGKWIVYQQGSDHLPLVKSLEGKNTGWCTAGESTAKSQLSNGDFYVYYSLDQNNQPSIPRVAIRMEGEEIAEVRGVAANQNMDPQINQSDILKSKMREFGTRADAFHKKDRDMKFLTQIETKHKLTQALTIDELRFLYEMDSKIDGFGYEKDPRIEKIKSTRDLKGDLIIITDHKYTRDEISITKDEAVSGKSKFHYGDLFLYGPSLDVRLHLPETINGTLHFRGLTSSVGVKFPKTINGDLILEGLASAAGVKLPNNVKGNLYLDDLTTAVDLNLPNFSGGLYLRKLVSAEGLKLPKIINGSLYLNSLVSAEGLKFPDTVNGGLALDSLFTTDGLKLPTTINGSLQLFSLTSAEGLKLPGTINGALYFNSLISADGLIFPRVVNGNLNLGQLASSKDLNLPTTVNGYLNLQYLNSVVGVRLPHTVNGDLILSSVVSSEGLELPNTVKGHIDLESLTSVEGLRFPKEINGGLYLSDLKSADNVTLPETINGDLILGGLTSAKKVKKPKGVKTYIGPKDIQE